MATKAKSKFELPDPAPLELVAGNVKDAMKNVEAGGEGGIRMVHPSKLRRLPGFSGRVRNAAYLEHVQKTKNSIIANGFFRHEPILVFAAQENGEDVLYVVDGHTRHEGVLLAIEDGFDIPAVPTIATPRGTSMADLNTFQVQANNGNREFSPLELAFRVKQQQGYGWEDAEIARKFNISEKYIGDLLLLVAAPRKLVVLVANEKITATLAIETLKKEKGDALDLLLAAVEKAEGEGKTKATGKHVAKKAPKKARAAEQPTAGRSIPEADVLHLAEEVGFVRGPDINAKLLTLAAQILGRFDITVESDEL